MMIKKTGFTGKWGLKGPVWILLIYSCVLFPVSHILFPQIQKWTILLYPAYFGLTLFILVFAQKITWRQLGFHTENWQQNIFLGGLAGGLIIIMVPLLDLIIDVSGMGQSDLFSGALERSLDLSKTSSSFPYIFFSMLLTVFAMQGFLTGYVVQTFLRKIKPVLAVYLAGLIFTLVHFDIQLGLFLIGFITAWFYFLTGSLLAPMIFQSACHIAGFLLTNQYPRVFTLLGFLY